MSNKQKNGFDKIKYLNDKIISGRKPNLTKFEILISKLNLTN